MHSEKGYWVILILSLTLFIVFVYYILIPFQVIGYDLGINLISETFGIVFTIIFLTWYIQSREVKQWKIVENKVKDRISHHLHEVYVDIFMLFIEPIPKMPDEIENEIQKIQNLGKKGEVKNWEEKRDAVIIEFLVNEKTIEFGLCGKAIFEKPDYYETSQMVRDFKEERQFFEHTITEYSRFLSPMLIRSLMEIEDCLDELFAVFSGYLTLVFYLNEDKVTLVDEKMNESLKPISENRTKNAIKKLIKEFHVLNKLNCGFVNGS